MKLKSFECPKSIRYYEKKILGTSDASSMSRLSHRPSEPAFYIVDCRILDVLARVMVYQIFHTCAMQYDSYMSCSLCKVCTAMRCKKCDFKHEVSIAFKRVAII